MKHAPTYLAILSLPAAAIGYAVTAALINGLDVSPGLHDLLIIIVPLFVAALCMAPFLLPFFDRMAKRDLEAYRAQQAAEQDADGPGARSDPPPPADPGA